MMAPHLPKRSIQKLPVSNPMAMLKALRRPASPSAGLYLEHGSARAGGESNQRSIVEGLLG
jgi:hypothetical protein